MIFDEKIKNEILQYHINREAALSSGITDKYKTKTSKTNNTTK